MALFPTSFDIPLNLIDGLDFCDAETINTIIQGAHACQLALGQRPADPDLSNLGSFNFPGSSVGEAVREFGRIEYGRVKIGLPNTAGTAVIYLRNPARFTKTSTNGVPIILHVRYLNADQEEPYLENQNFPHSTAIAHYDGAGDLDGLELTGLNTAAVNDESEVEYMAMEVNW
jgi:hypothetical protein